VIPKLEEPLGDAKSYRPRSHCVSHSRSLKRLICARVETVVEPLRPQEQPSFQHGMSTVDQFIQLKQDIKDSFSAKKTGAAFVDLTATYKIAWHRGLTCKLLRLLPDRHVVRMIMELVCNCSFTLTTSNDKRNVIRRFKNGVPQGFVLAPLVFSNYTSDLPPTVSRKYAYADDVAIMHAADGDWQAMEGVLSKDMPIDEYLQTWKLKLAL